MEKTIDTMTPAERDDFIATHRLPELRRTRDEITKRLVELFREIGFSIDPDWKQNESASEVQTLLLGNGVTSAGAMPLPAEHWLLLRRRHAVERALELAEQAAWRHDQRLINQRLEASRLEIEALDRRRVLLALELQAVNRKRNELRKKIGLDPRAIEFPSDGVELLGLGNPNDEVHIATQRLLRLKLITTRDLGNVAK